MPKRTILWLSFAAAFLACLPIGSSATPQKVDSFNMERSRWILRDAYDLIKKNYYDPKFHGVEWDARFHEYDEKMKNTPSLGQQFGVVAGFLDGLNDSHVYFNPPGRTSHVDYGYRLQVFGDHAFVTHVRPDTDAASKLHVGDEVLALNRFNLNRGNLHKLIYYYRTLAPQKASLLLLRDPDGHEHEVIVDAMVRPLKSVLEFTDIWQMIRDRETAGQNARQRYIEMGDAFIWKMPEFVLSDIEIDRIFGIARKHKALVLDLRGNPGGYTITLEHMLGSIFDHDVKISDRRARKDSKPQLAKSRGGNVFTGKLIVLIDSASASAAELFARVVQLEHRGTVLGDHSSGSVMEARYYPCSQGQDTAFFYGFSITDADLIMADGKSLEHTGVIPDELLLPTAQDLASGSDPVLARAAQLAGVTIEPAAAGKLFPFECLPL
jgi:C-terminal processing protease CtpA/Prc